VEDLGSDDIVKRALAWCPKELKDKMTVEALQKQLDSLSQVLSWGTCACVVILDSARLH
jgi:hypothetical protein